MFRGVAIIYKSKVYIYVYLSVPIVCCNIIKEADENTEIQCHQCVLHNYYRRFFVFAGILIISALFLGVEFAILSSRSCLTWLIEKFQLELVHLI